MIDPDGMWAEQAEKYRHAVGEAGLANMELFDAETAEALHEFLEPLRKLLLLLKEREAPATQRVMFLVGLAIAAGLDEDP